VFHLYTIHSLESSRSIVLSVSAILLVNCTAPAPVVSFGARRVVFSPECPFILLYLVSYNYLIILGTLSAMFRATASRDLTYFLFHGRFKQSEKANHLCLPPTRTCLSSSSPHSEDVCASGDHLRAVVTPALTVAVAASSARSVVEGVVVIRDDGMSMLRIDL
jgi:hypothetical protein